jgi:hypothetical protein
VAPELVAHHIACTSIGLLLESEFGNDAVLSEREGRVIERDQSHAIASAKLGELFLVLVDPALGRIVWGSFGDRLRTALSLRGTPVVATDLDPYRLDTSQGCGKLTIPQKRGLPSGGAG